MKPVVLQQLKDRFRSELIQPNDASYDAARKVYDAMHDRARSGRPGRWGCRHDRDSPVRPRSRACYCCEGWQPGPPFRFPSRARCGVAARLGKTP